MGKTTLRQKIETLIVVSLITVLVWLYAEGRNVQSYTNEPVPVRFVSGDGEGLTISPEGSQRVLVSFQGSTAMKQTLDTLIKEGPVTIPVVEQPNAPGAVQSIIMRDALNNSSLRDLGIQVTSSDPAVLQVTVRRLVSVEMTVIADVPITELVDSPTVEPSRVAIKVPAPLASMAEDLALTARINEADLANLPANTPRTLNVRLDLPEALQGQPVEWTTRNVAVTLTIRRQTDSITLSSVPIHINIPPYLLQRYRVSLPEDQQVIRDVRLNGPADAIAAIRDQEFRVWAEFFPTSDDLDSNIDQASLRLRLPPGVTAEGPPPRVPITVHRLD